MKSPIRGGAGDDIVTVGSGFGTLSLGAGNNTVNLGTLSNTVSIDFGTGSDRLNLQGIASTQTGFAHVSGLTSGDVISFAGTIGTASNLSTQINLGAQLTGPTTLNGFLDSATQGDGSGTTSLHWFQYGGNTYLVHDTSANATFTAGSDTVVQLVGLIDLTASVVSNGVVTV